MDILLSPAFVPYEVGAFLGSLIYVFATLFGRLGLFLWRIRRAVLARQAIVERMEDAPIVKAPETPVAVHEEEVPHTLTSEEKQTIGELITVVRLHIARGELHDARARVVEGLSIDKFNKELNILLASLYEIDRDYKKAELVYKDLIILHDSDTEIYLKLGFVLAIQSKFEIAFEIYKKLHALDENNYEAVEMLANIAHKLERYEDSTLYAKIFLRQYPHNTDILYLLAVNYINTSQPGEALETLRKLRTIEPYNTTIAGLIEKVSASLNP